MYAYELLPKLIYLTLTGQDDDGELEFVGTQREWENAEQMEANLSMQ